MLTNHLSKHSHAAQLRNRTHFLKRIHSEKVLPYLLLLLLFATVTACRHDTTPANWRETLRLERLDHQLMREGGGSTIMARDSTFGVLWCRLLHFEGTERYANYLDAFASDSTMQALQDSIEASFPLAKDPAKSLEKGFAWLHRNMPSISIPRIYFINGGFNAPCMMDTAMLGIALECFLGQKSTYYEKLQIPQYLRRQMDPKRIAPAAITGWLEGMYMPMGSMRTVLDNMLYQGKLLYIARQALPQLPEHVVLGFSKEELEWLTASEGSMWRYLSEKEVIFDSNPLIVTQFTGPAPFTRAFGNDSPGRASVWLGYRIVESYFKANPSASIERIYFSSDSQQLLAKAKYAPK